MAVPARALRKWALRAGGSAVALGLIFWFLPREAIVDGFRSIPLPLFLFVLACFCIAHVAAATKWWLLMDRAIAYGTALRAHFAGLAANLCLPGAAGGDAVRAAVLGRGADRPGLCRTRPRHVAPACRAGWQRGQ